MSEEISNRALVRNYSRAGGTIVAMLLASLGCFITGIFLPFTGVTKLWLFENHLFVFTICFPFVKINAMLLLWLWPRLDGDLARRWYHFVADIGKWSMLDVFIMAILVLTVKSTGVATIQVGIGFFLFFASVMLTQLASLWTGKVVARVTK
jgi:paraquat-inducible protein A